MIDPMADDLINTAQDRPSRRRRPRSPAQAISGEEVSVSDLLNNLNETDTLTSALLKDRSAGKRVTLQAIGNQSAAAKRIVAQIDENESVRMNGNQAVELLKLMSDIFDNKFLSVE